MIVLDTHVILWDALKPELIPNRARKAIQRANDTDAIIFCDISLWEIAMLMKRSKVDVDVKYKEFVLLLLASNKYLLQGITPEIADLAVNLPIEINRDPADRIICATSIISKADLVTADKNLLNAKAVQTIW